MPHPLPDSQVERFLRGRHVGVLTTIGASGMPMQTPVWYLYRDGRLYVRTNSLSDSNLPLRPYGAVNRIPRRSGMSRGSK